MENTTWLTLRLPAGGFADTDLREVHQLMGLNTIRTMSTIRRLVAKL